MTAPRFTLADLERANAEWQCSCGPASLAAICGLTLDEARACFQPDWPGYTNVRMMRDALALGRANWRAWTPTRDGHGIDWPLYGLALIQWEGPWTEPCAPSRERYARLDRAKRTHWVGVRTRSNVTDKDASLVDVWDVNAMTSEGANGWLRGVAWFTSIVPLLTADIKRATGGWHVTHAIEVDRPTGQALTERVTTVAERR